MENTKKKLGKNTVIGQEDVYIGLRIREARTEKGYTQTSLARVFNISSQQVQKFEFGRNRVTAKMLYKISRLCDKPMEWFTQDIDNPEEFHYHNPIKNNFALNILRYFEKIDCRKKQVKALKLIRMFLEEST